MKHLVETNIVVVLQQAEELMKNGYKVTELSTAFIYEMKLEKQKESSEKIPFTERGELKTIECYEALEFLSQMKFLVDNGYTMSDNDFYWDSWGFKRMHMKNDVVPDKLVYTQEELQEMPWEELKSLAKFHGHGGRDRNVMVTKILKSQEEIN